MANNDYISLSRVHELNKRMAKYQDDLNDLNTRIAKSIEECEQLEKKLVELDPAIAKKLEKAKGNPKSIDNKTYGWYDCLDEKHTIAWDFGLGFKYAYFEGPREIAKINQKIDELKVEVSRIEARLSKHFNLRDNLPAEFKEALQVVKNQIRKCFEYDQNSKIKQYEECLKYPMFYSLIKYEYLLKYLEKHGKLEKKSDEEIIEQYGKYYVSGYSYPTVEKTLIERRDHFIKTTQAKITHEKNRNIDQETEMYYKEVECQFIDQIAVYCEDILSVENCELGQDGSINGTIHSSNGDWYIKTIGAGGYNIQRFHYRVIMRKLNIQ